MLLGTLATSMSGSALTGKGVIRVDGKIIRAGVGKIKAGESTIRPGGNF